MRYLIDKIYEVFIQLIDNDTLIIIGAFIIAGISPEHRELVLGGCLGFIGKKYKDGV